ncbi:30S ribosomal protein S16 [Egibacter rhizosphaerae]|uniref:Small ribosomal subunit protein bS16 n=1 Tax=Egibacter rhizosphaerae TaxID=1670831 RepID=A0A411YCK7_9ACTN|nr:30S ribosomal protein S16 [Egibacter rhizosphaerae]
MAVKMRLRREGKKKQPFYRVVVADVRSPRDGRFIEDLGYYQPLAEPSAIEINHERALAWLHDGVQPSDAVKRLLRITGVWEEFRPGDPGKDRTARNERKEASKAAQAEAVKRREAEQQAASKSAATESAGEESAEQATAAEGAASTDESEVTES